MAEIWDIYDKDRNKTGRLAQRGVDRLKEGEYHIVVTAVILNSKNEILITQRASFKAFPFMWECNGGSILAGETSLQGIIREVKEEVGVEFKEEDAVFLKTLERSCVPPDFKDIWIFRKDIDDSEITLPDGEAVCFKWVTIDEFEEMFKNNEIVPSVDFDRSNWEIIIRKIN